MLTMKLALRCVKAGSSASLECIRKLVGERYVSECISARNAVKLSFNLAFLLYSFVSLALPYPFSTQGGSYFTGRGPEKQVSETRVVQLHFTAQ